MFCKTNLWLLSGWGPEPLVQRGLHWSSEGLCLPHWAKRKSAPALWSPLLAPASRLQGASQLVGQAHAAATPILISGHILVAHADQPVQNAR